MLYDKGLTRNFQKNIGRRILNVSKLATKFVLKKASSVKNLVSYFYPENFTENMK